MMNNFNGAQLTNELVRYQLVMCGQTYNLLFEVQTKICSKDNALCFVCGFFTLYKTRITSIVCYAGC